MSKNHPTADWSRLREEPDLTVPLPGGLKMLFRRIPAGSFMMGSRGGPADEEPRHRVVIPHDFYLGKYVVTQAEWRAVAALSPTLTDSPGLDPSHKVNTGDRRPATDVSWDDATAWSAVFTPRLAGVAGLPAGVSARLPTEAEWEYACRAGTDTDYYSGDGEAALAEVARFGGEWDGGAHAERHPAGLHGMHGNVWELCRDVRYEDTYRRQAEGAVSPHEELRGHDEHRQLRVLRGGSWVCAPSHCRSAARYEVLPDFRDWYQGFRLCLAPGPAFTETSADKPAVAEQPETGKAEAETGALTGLLDLTCERINPPRGEEKAAGGAAGGGA